MAKQTTITRKCGHTEEKYMHGRAARIAAQVATAEGLNCNACTMKPAAKTPAATRTVVKLGSVKVGDILNGSIVTGLGQHWFCNSADDGMTDPWLDGQYVQYAYSN